MRGFGRKKIRDTSRDDQKLKEISSEKLPKKHFVEIGPWIQTPVFHTKKTTFLGETPSIRKRITDTAGKAIVADKVLNEL